MFGGIFGSMGGGFNQNYRAYPAAFIEKESAEKGDKVILPPSALQTLASMHVQYPMLFRTENRREQLVSHCGVLEFVAQEGMCYMPQWMMDNLLLGVGDLVNLKNVSLPKGSFIKIQPHSKDFLDISNPKAVLETSLRSFTCLTKGDTFRIEYDGRMYLIDVIDVKPDTAISVVETDISVDFAPPKDYVEPDYQAQAAAAAAAATSVAQSDTNATSKAGEAGPSAQPGKEAEEAKEPLFYAFGGTGKRLDGKQTGPAKPIAVPLSQVGRTTAPFPSGQAATRAGDDEKATTSTPESASNPSGLKAGTVVFGEPAEGGVAGNRLAARLAKKKTAGGAPGSSAPKVKEKEEKKDEGPSFSAFAGKGRSLRD